MNLETQMVKLTLSSLNLNLKVWNGVKAPVRDIHNIVPPASPQSSEYGTHKAVKARF